LIVILIIILPSFVEMAFEIKIKITIKNTNGMKTDFVDTRVNGL
jgi:hypothetical protein